MTVFRKRTTSINREGYSANASKVADGVVQLDKRGKFPESWVYVPPLKGNSKEHLGYPTQKPLALIDRIIEGGSNEGDIVLDPFCGCGTSIESSQRLKRQWIGIDISSFAIDLIKEKRLQGKNIPTYGIPYDFQSAKKLAQERPFDFESWAVMRLPGFIPNTKQVADGGVDGRATLAKRPQNYNSRLALAQIKGGHFNMSQLRDFIGVTERDRAAIGCYVTLDPITSKSARTAIVSSGKIKIEAHTYQRHQLWSIYDYFDNRFPLMPIMTDPYSGKPMSQIPLEI